MTENKPWERPWSMDDMIDNSGNWSLAGDVALLNTLKAFAENLVKKTTEVNTKLQGLSGDFDETSLKLDLAQNRFQSLRNTQFIESRVYEDDETLPQPEIAGKVEAKTDGDRTEEIKEAVMKGLEVLDRYFDKVEVSVSDSEDDTDFPNYVLRPKDLYIDRPLPYVIGSEEWHKNWHVGLEDSSSDSETEKISGKYSDNDSESDLPLTFERSQIKGGSDSSSELDFSKTEPEIPPKAPTRDLFLSSDSEDQNSIPAEARLSDKSFAEQLAEKLGSVVGEPEVNRRPIQTNPQPRYARDLFFDEPPPLDDEPKAAGGLFSGGSGLFDDNDEDDGFFAQKPPALSEVPKLPQQQSLGLFDGDDSDDDMFTSAKPNPQPLRIDKLPLFAEEPPALETKKRPVGGVSIFGASNLFDKKLLKRVDSDEETEGKVEDEIDRVEPLPVKQPKQEKSAGLFDDDDDLFRDDLFSASSNKKFTSNLFDDDETDELFAAKTVAAEPGGLFDDVDDKNSINFDKGRNQNVTKPVSSDNLFGSSPLESANRLFGDVEDDLSVKVEGIASKVETSTTPKETKPNLFGAGEREEIDNQSSQQGGADLFASTPPKAKEFLSGTTERQAGGLFDSPPPNDDIDDLFGAGAKNASIDEKVFKNEPKSGLFESSGSDYESASVKPSCVSLFDSVPPPDDEWDTKSDVSDFETEPPYREEAPRKWGLFDEEPPALDPEPPRSELKLPNKVSDITSKFEKEDAPSSPSKPVTSPGKLKHNLKINVGALMPGSAPPPKRPDFESPPAIDDLEGEIPTFDSLDNVEVLQNVIKDRVRVPFARRPSTRRGRKAALKTSTPDFKLDQDGDVVDANSENAAKKNLFEHEETIGTSASKAVVSKTKDTETVSALSPTAEVSKTNLFDGQERVGAFTSKESNFKIDLFDDSAVDVNAAVSTTDLFSNQDAISARTVEAKVSKTDLFDNRPTVSALPRKTATSKTDLFEDLAADSALKTNSALFTTNLFNNQEAVSASTTKVGVSTTDLFDDQETAPDLFADLQTVGDFSSKVGTSKTNLFKKESKPKSAPVKVDLFDDDDDFLFGSSKRLPKHPPKVGKSLFDDDDDGDDEDMFKSSASAPKKPEMKVTVEKRVPKINVRKLENSKPDDDPLSALLK